MSLSERIKGELENFGLEEPAENVMNKLTDLCSSLDIKPSDLADQWMAFSVNNGNLELDIDGVGKFERYAQTKQNKPVIKKEKKSVLNATTNIGDLFDDLLDAYIPDSSPMRSQKRPLDSPSTFRVSKVSKTPTRTNQSVSRLSRDMSATSLSPVNASPSQSYGQRKGTGDVVCTFNEGGLEVENFTGSGRCPDVKLSPSTLATNYQYMFQKLSSKTESLDEHLEIMTATLAQFHGGAEFESLCIPSQGTTRVVGRVCGEGVGRLTPSTVCLEGSLEISHGKRTSLDLRNVSSYALFPGQVIAVEGTNPTGRNFVATKILSPVPIKQDSKESDENSSGLTVMGACGPFTSQDSLSYEPLKDLLEKVRDEHPDVLVLLGPFVDTKHPLIEKGDTGDITLEQLFHSQISHISNNVPDYTRVILVPSQRDAVCDTVYPQPAPSTTSTLPPNITLVPDPCLVQIGNVSLALTSTDVLFHLSSEEISHPPGSDRMGRLAGHLLDQNNFYPLFPGSDDCNIDYPHFNKHCFFDHKPDVLVLPSDLRYFVKNVKDTVVVNPGKLAKGAGTFFRMRVKGGVQKVTESTYVNVVKI